VEFIDETNEDYHARTEVSASWLKKLDESPRLFEAHYVTRTIESKQTDAMRLGTAVHCAILEPQKFDAQYAVCPEDCSDRRTNKHKAWAETVLGRQILTADEFQKIKSCEAAVHRNDIARLIIKAATHKEKSFVYRDFLTSVDCRVRFDALAGDAIVDIKTVSDGSEDEFIRSIDKYRYHLQASHYLEGFKTLDPSRDWQFVFITVETVAPYRCRTFSLDNEWLSMGADLRSALLESYKIRLQNGDWSESGENQVTPLSPPPWIRRKAFSL
jgi:hypothetical protein